MSQVLVSIVIPCYNAEPYVRDAITSSLGQTYPNTEVLVIDDGSTDKSLDAIKEYGTQIQWETGPNRGACAARNRGLALARGDFIQFLDADDVLHPEKLARQVPDSLARLPEIVFCRWNSELTSANAQHLCSRGEFSKDGVIQALQKVVQTSASMYPTQVLRKLGGWREELPCAQDFDLNLRLACSGVTFHELPETLFTLRRVEGSVSSDLVRVLKIFGEVYWRAYHQLAESGDLTEERAAAFAAGFAGHGRTFLRYGLVKEARERFADAYRMHPSGGVSAAYRPWTRVLRRLVGPVTTERLVQFKRRLASASVTGEE